MSPSNVRELIQCVEEVYRDFDGSKINRIWLTLMSCMNCIIDVHGDNNYNIPHLGKEALARRDDLPETIRVTETGMPYLE